MSDFTLNVGGVETVAPSDMNLPFPTPIAQLFPITATDGWTPYIERYPETSDGEQILIEVGYCLVRSQGRVVLIDTGCCGLIQQCV